MAEGPLEEAVLGKDVEVEWMPFELRPYPEPTLEPEGEYLQRAWKESVYPMAERMGVKILLPRVSPQPYTHLAFEGYQYAKECGKAKEYNHRMFTAFFQEEQDIGKIEVLTKLAGEIGLDEEKYKKALVTRKYKDLHRQALEHAYSIPITAVPTFLIGKTMLRGLYRKDALSKVIDEELRELF